MVLGMKIKIIPHAQISQIYRYIKKKQLLLLSREFKTDL